MSANGKGETGGLSGAERGSAQAFLVPVTFLVLAAIFLWNPVPFRSPVGPPEPVPPWAVDTSPVRHPVLEPVTTIAVYKYRCSECHDLMDSPPETDRPLTQHRQIQLDHGINDRCFNCHLRENRNGFADYRGNPLPFDQPEHLCAKCHGPVYRDWTHGVHGRTEGYWDTALGPMKRRKCTECHDPHRPAFRPLKPAPPPRTLRMGDQTIHGESEKTVENPLLIHRKAVSASQLQ